jgi:hypothetical protein
MIVYPDSLDTVVFGDTTGVLVDVREADLIASPFGPVYRQTRSSEYTLEVLDSEWTESRQFFRLSNGQLLSHSDAGNILEHVHLPWEETRATKLLFDFASPSQESQQTLTRIPYHLLACKAIHLRCALSGLAQCIHIHEYPGRSV